MNVFSLPAISPISSDGASNSRSSVFSSPDAAPADGPSFAQTLQSAFGQVNSLQNHSAEMAHRKLFESRLNKQKDFGYT